MIESSRGHLLDQGKHAIAVGVKLFDEHVTVCLADNEAIFSEKVMQVQSVDVLLAVLVDSTEGV